MSYRLAPRSQKAIGAQQLRRAPRRADPRERLEITMEPNRCHHWPQIPDAKQGLEFALWHLVFLWVQLSLAIALMLL